MMKKVFLLPVIIILLTASCRKDKNDGMLGGKYIEKSPLAGRCQLDFISADRIVRKERGSTVADTFIYSLTDSTITLQPAWTNKYKSYPIYFRKLSSRAFEIEYLYATSGMIQIPPMIFEQQ